MSAPAKQYVGVVLIANMNSHLRRPRASIQLAPWQRTLYTIVLAETAAMIGFGIAQPFLPFYLQELGVHSVGDVAFWVGLISSAQPICMALSAPIWGVLSDRFGRKPMLARAMIGGGIALGLSAMATSAPQLATFRILEGILAGTVAAATTLVAVTTPREHTGYGLGLLQTAIFTGSFLGPLLGGIIGSTLGYRAAFLVAGSADRLGRRRVLISCVVMGALSYLPQGLTRHAWQLLALRVITGFSMGGISPVTNAVIAEAVPEGGHGSVYGISASLNAMGRAVGPLIGTVIVTSWSVAGVFPVTGSLLLLVAVLATVRMRSLPAFASPRKM